MNPDAVRELYDQATADTYDERWHGEPWGNDTFHLAQALAPHIHKDTRWLDVGCGTGRFLSDHQGVERAGLDLSPAMLEHAKSANPDATFHEADFREDIPEFHDAWTLVSCTGEPFSYVDTLAEVERLVEQMARWTAPGGTSLVAIQDITDLTGMSLPYEIPGNPGFPGEITIKGLIWSMVDRSDPKRPRDHEDLIWPTLEHWIAMFSRFFARIVIEHLPHDPAWLPTPRRVLIATEKRVSGDISPAQVTFVDPPVDSGSRLVEVAPAPPPPLRSITLGELMDRTRPLDPDFWRSVIGRVRHR